VGAWTFALQQVLHISKSTVAVTFDFGTWSRPA